MPGAIIIGASSGIGAALARRLSAHGYKVGLAARRVELLERLRAELPNPAFIKALDVSQPEQAIPALQELAREMGDVELYVMNAGVGFLNPQMEWTQERQTIDVNVLGFAAMVNVAMHALEARAAGLPRDSLRAALPFGRVPSGHLVGISSISALRGGRAAPAYNASKAFVSNYLEGIRQRCQHRKLGITVTDIQPGFVDTPMAQSPTLFWMASADRAAEQIHAAILGRKRHAYVTKRWRLVAWLLKGLPAVLYQRM